MRQIKFRAFRELTGMSPVAELEFDDGKLIYAQLFYDHLDKPEYETLDVKDIELMQFTGVKDKNGKEIYEGDLLNTAGSPSEVRWNEDRWDVYWHWRDQPGWHDGIVGLKEDHDRLEVIGNIYENPELLESNPQ